MQKKDPADKFPILAVTVRPDQARFVDALAHKSRASRAEMIQDAIDLLAAAYPMTAEEVAELLSDKKAGRRAPALGKPSAERIAGELDKRRWRESNAPRRPSLPRSSRARKAA